MIEKYFNPFMFWDYCHFSFFIPTNFKLYIIKIRFGCHRAQFKAAQFVYLLNDMCAIKNNFAQ